MADDDFNRAILKEVSHRPWPMPNAPWVMTQTWHDLLFAHWPADVLDAAICAVQAAWAATRPNYGIPAHAPPHEGWIVSS